MQPYQQRVIEEKADLDAKIERLTAFRLTDIYAFLETDDRDLLKQQYRAMRRYSTVLADRIARFGDLGV